MEYVSWKVYSWISLERRVEYNYTKYGDSPVCLSEKVDIPNQRVFSRGYGLQADETTGELLQLELETLTNEECYNRHLTVSETFLYGSRGQKLTKTGTNEFLKNEITNSIKEALYDGITDQVLCTVTTCDGKDSSLDRLAKCVSNDRRHVETPFTVIRKFSLGNGV